MSYASSLAKLAHLDVQDAFARKVCQCVSEGDEGADELDELSLGARGRGHLSGVQNKKVFTFIWALGILILSGLHTRGRLRGVFKASGIYGHFQRHV